MNTRRTWILILILLALVGLWLYLKNKPESPSAEADTTPTVTVKPMEFLFPKEEGVVTSILIKNRAGTTLKLTRVGSDWSMSQPDSAKADTAAVEEAASQLTAISVETQLSLDPSQVGLTDPEFTITVEFSSGKSITTRIGDVTPIETGYYASKEDGVVIVVSKDGIDVLTAMLNTLPYAETPTPSPTPAPTGTPTPTAAATETIPASGSETPTVTEMP